jgi:hypothetical protein
MWHRSNIDNRIYIRYCILLRDLVILIGYVILCLNTQCQKGSVTNTFLTSLLNMHQEVWWSKLGPYLLCMM